MDMMSEISDSAKGTTRGDVELGFSRSPPLSRTSLLEAVSGYLIMTLGNEDSIDALAM